MKGSKQIKREARQLFRLCLVDGSLEEGRVREVVRQALQSKRRGVYAVLSEFLRLIRLDRAQHTAGIESASDLPADLRASVAANLERVYGQGLSSSFSINPTLIGGMRIKVGSDVYDGSIKAKLSALEKRF
jgi:F-type H+-transporting ATPase subunit delta